MSASETSYRLLRHGLLLFLLGLTTGVTLIGASHLFSNPRLAVSSHLVGVTNGMFLICAGLLAKRVSLPDYGWRRTYWLFLFGAYGNWVGTLAGAVLGTSVFMPVAGDGHSGPGWEEIVVGTILTASGIAIITACIIFFRGLVREEK